MEISNILLLSEQAFYDRVIILVSCISSVSGTKGKSINMDGNMDKVSYRADFQLL